jgi:phage host-nuclease inhibitor protein Gam
MIQDMLIENEGELTPELENRLDALMIAGPDKIEAGAMVVRTLESSADACKNEAKRLLERARSFDANADRLKQRMVYALDAAFNGKVKTDRFTIWTQKSSDSTAVDLAEEFTLDQLQSEHPEFVRTKLELDKTAIKAAYDAETPLPDSVFVIKTEGKRYLRLK